jgi:hypothetical protein
MMRRLCRYLVRGIRWRRRYGDLTLPDLMRWYPRWTSSLDAESRPLEAGIPWMTIPAIAAMQRSLRPHHRVFEWGMGGSTVFLAERAGELVSVEHDAGWMEAVSRAMAMRGLRNWRGIHAAHHASAMVERGDASDPSHYLSGAEEFHDRSFQAYASTIDSFPDGHFDLIVIDGRARPSCLRHALPKIAVGGDIVWDNTDRDYYQPTMSSIPSSAFVMTDFPGPVACSDAFGRTTAWKRLA